MAGETYTEDEHVKFVTWSCKDFVYATDTLLEFGYMDMDVLSEFKLMGFVLYDGGHTGEFAAHQRQGINHRWDWGDDLNYSFVIKPDGTGLFYDFSSVQEGEGKKADDVYKCYK